MRSGLVAALVAACASATACSAPSGADGAVGSSGAELSVARSEFDAILRDAERAEADCHARGACARGGGTRPTAYAGPVTNRRASSFSMCEALEPFRALGNPYFFAGASAKAAYVATLTDGGLDLVFDLENKQAAVFFYTNHGIQNLVGVGANAYVGYAFGRKSNVIDAWSGEFQAAEATIEVPVLNLALGGVVFRAPDNSIWGGAVEAAVGLNLVGLPAEVAASEGHWTPWDAATKWYGSKLWLTRYEEKRALFHEKSHTLLQFRGARDLAAALLQTFGLAGAQAAAYAAALAALEKAGLTVEAACPRVG